MIQWLTTLPSPKSPATGYDCGQRGWRVHAVEAPETAKFSEIKTLRAACGLVPAHGWGMDLYIERRCTRCELALGLPLSESNRLSIEYRRELRGQKVSP